VARGEDRPDSDLDFVVEPPKGADLFDVMHLEEAFIAILGRDIDLVTYGGLDPELDRDILRDTVLV
jgi:predicted nucleotidyltransferase